MQKNQFPTLSLFVLAVWLLGSCAAPVDMKGPSAASGTFQVSVPALASWATSLGSSAQHSSSRALLVADSVSFSVKDSLGTLVDSWSQSPVVGAENQGTSTPPSGHGTLPVGTYTLEVKVYNLNNSSSAPVVKGTSAPFTIVADRSTDVAISCLPANPLSLTEGTSLANQSLGTAWSYTVAEDQKPVLVSHGTETWCQFTASTASTTITVTPTGGSKALPMFAVYDSGGAGVAATSYTGQTSGTPIPLTVATTSGSTYFFVVVDVGGNLSSSKDQSVSILVAATTTPGPSAGAIPRDGLIAEWLFSGNASDTAGTYNAMVNGATLTTDRSGAANSAYAFDGTSDYLAIPHSAALNPGTGSFSYSLWARTSVPLEQFPLVKMGPNMNNGYFLRLDADSSGVSSDFDDSSFLWDRAIMVSKAGLTDGRYHHFVSILDREKQVNTLYCDGVLVGSNSTNIGTQNCNYTGELRIGWYQDTQNAVSKFFNGSLDDVRLYNRALTAEEVTALYGSATVSGTVTLPASVTNKPWVVIVDTDLNGGNGFTASATGKVTGSSFAYSVLSVPTGTYFVYALVFQDLPGPSGPLAGDFMGIVGSSGSEKPVTPNVTVTSAGATGTDLTLGVYDGSSSLPPMTGTIADASVGIRTQAFAAISIASNAMGFALNHMTGFPTSAPSTLTQYPVTIVPNNNVSSSGAYVTFSDIDLVKHTATTHVNVPLAFTGALGESGNFGANGNLTFTGTYYTGGGTGSLTGTLTLTGSLTGTVTFHNLTLVERSATADLTIDGVRYTLVF